MLGKHHCHPKNETALNALQVKFKTHALQVKFKTQSNDCQIHSVTTNESKANHKTAFQNKQGEILIFCLIYLHNITSIDA